MGLAIAVHHAPLTVQNTKAVAETEHSIITVSLFAIKRKQKPLRYCLDWCLSFALFIVPPDDVWQAANVFHLDYSAIFVERILMLTEISLSGKIINVWGNLQVIFKLQF